MKVTHLQSSTQIIHMGNLNILTDPWLTDGEYYGSWYHYPPFGAENIATLQYDYIYVSHIHPDHLSEETFRKLPCKKPVLIQKYDSQFVKRKLEMLGYEVIECGHGKPFTFKNGGTLTIYAADNCDPELCSKFLGCGLVEEKFEGTQIDTIALFSHDGQHILNTNDCPYELASKTIKSNKIDNLNINLLLVGYAGAGPYPQCFHFDNLHEKHRAATEKEKQFLGQSLQYIELVKPKVFAPFAGTYILGSRLSHLNKYRGVPTLKDSLKYIMANLKINSKGILLQKLDIYDLSRDVLTKFVDADVIGYSAYLKKISAANLAYDNDDWNDNELPTLVQNAYQRFFDKANSIGFSSETSLIIQSERVAYRFSTGRSPHELGINEKIEGPFVKISVDHNLLHRLLMGPRFAHWNNAEIGSHLSYLRRPDKFERGLYHSLCFFHQ